MKEERRKEGRKGSRKEGENVGILNDLLSEKGGQLLCHFLISSLVRSPQTSISALNTSLFLAYHCSTDTADFIMTG